MRTSPETPPDVPPNGGAPLDYVQRVNRAIDWILLHLEEPLNLEVVARAASFSPFHFHRIFRALLGETLQQFVNRLRLERALSMLSHAPGRSLTDIAFACGFGSSSDFSRSFKKRYGVPPSAFDIETFRASQRSEWQAALADAPERHRLDRLPPGTNPDGFEAHIRPLPARRVAYIRVQDSFRPGVVRRAVERMVSWAEARGLAGGQWLGYSWDDPEVVAHEDCRYDVGIEVAHVEREGEIGCFEFPAMHVAQVEVRGPIELELRALDWLFTTWLPTSGFVPASQPCFEAWIGRPFAHGEEHFELHAQVPIERG